VAVEISKVLMASSCHCRFIL